MAGLLPNTSQLLRFCADSCFKMQQTTISPNLKSIFHFMLTILTGIAPVAPVNSQTVTISASFSVPKDASQIIDHNFPSFAVEKSSWYLYSGNKSNPNVFSENLIQSIQSKTGKGLIIRVGGTSGDHDSYNSSQVVPVVKPANPNNVNVLWGIVLGADYFESFSNFPNSFYTFQVPLAQNQGSPSLDSLEQTRLALGNITLARLDSLEIGNEPNLYASQGMRSDNYDPAEYVEDVLDYEEYLRGNLTGDLTLPSGPLFQVLTYADGVSDSWTEHAAFDAGLDINNTVKSVSYHFYQTSVNKDVRLQADLMNHSVVVGNLSNFLAPIAYLQANHSNIPFTLAEVGSSLNPSGNNYDLQGVLGSALWTIDFMLYAMSINITRVNMQQGVGFGYAAWQPVAYNGTESYGPHVRAPYYGIVFVADFIGQNSELQISNIDLGNDWLSAYAGYESGELAKYAVVNLEAWNTTQNGTRPVQELSLEVPSTTNTIRVDYLTGPGSDAFVNVTWAGDEWTYASNGLAVQVADTSKTVWVSGGVANVSVQASEAILVTLL